MPVHQVGLSVCLRGIFAEGTARSVPCCLACNLVQEAGKQNQRAGQQCQQARRPAGRRSRSLHGALGQMEA
eukprot:14057366-Alexandrium_andersonii.AAC.1